MPPELTTLALGEESLTTLATNEEEPVTGLTTWNMGEEYYLPTQALGEDGPSTRAYGEEGEHIPDTGVENPFGGF